MSLANSVLKAAGFRTAAHGGVDRRHLNRAGRPRKTHTDKPYEMGLLHREFELMQPGDMIEWDWRTPGTHADKKLRNAQCMYAYKAAEIFGVKVALSSHPNGLRITMVGKREELTLGGYL